MQIFTYFVNIFFEALFEHLISFVEHNSLQRCKVNVTALNVIQHTSASTNKEVDTVSE